MGRTLSGTMATILAGTRRDIDYTLDLTVGVDAFHFATSVLTAVNGHDYQNLLEKVGEIRQTLEAPTDRVAVQIENLDRDLGLHVSTNWQSWRTATAVIGRNYYQIGANGTRTGTSAWIELFRGGVQQPNIDDLKVTFDIIPDTTSPGQIVCSRTCGATCGFVVNDPKTCGLTGATCNHHLKSALGCSGNNNKERFGGTEHEYQPEVAAPGTGGNDPDDPPINTCPRLDQYIRILGENGVADTKLVSHLDEKDWLWDPIERDFFPIRTLRVIRDVPIWAVVADNGACSESSFSHRLMPNEEHPTGLPVEKLDASDELLTEIYGEMQPSHILFSMDTGERGDVMFIEMQGGHHYAAGDEREKLVVAHNAKQGPL